MKLVLSIILGILMLWLNICNSINIKISILYILLLKLNYSLYLWEKTNNIL